MAIARQRSQRLTALDAKAAAELAGHPARGARFRRLVLESGADDAQGARRSDDQLHCRVCGQGFYEMLALLKHGERCPPTPPPRRTRTTPSEAA